MSTAILIIIILVAVVLVVIVGGILRGIRTQHRDRASTPVRRRKNGSTTSK